MTTPSPKDDLPVRPIDRFLAFTSLGLLVASVLAFFAIIIGSSSGADMSTGMWPTVGIFVYIAPVLAFLLLFAVLTMSIIRRSRANRGG